MKKKLKERLIERILDLLDENQRLKELLQENNAVSGSKRVDIDKITLFKHRYVSSDEEVRLSSDVITNTGLFGRLKYVGSCYNENYTGGISVTLVDERNCEEVFSIGCFIPLSEWESNS